MIKITPDIISSTIHVPRVIHPIYPYLSTGTLPANSLVRSTLFNSPLGGGPQAIGTEIPSYWPSDFVAYCVH